MGASGETPTKRAPEVRLAADPDEVVAALELRVEVFCDEQGVAREAEVDGRDHDALHVIAIADEGVVATCRLLFEEQERCWLGRMAVAAQRRGTGVGRELVRVAEEECARRGAREVVLHAQLHAEPFYASCGYSAEGDTFIEEGIEHVLMRKELTAG